MKLIFATRPSALARRQTAWVIERLQRSFASVECEELVLSTHGDRMLDKPLPEIGGKGVFTQELEVALLAGRAQAAVHSLKDLPVEPPAGLVIAAIPEREDARDVLISATHAGLQALPVGSQVGTSSLRRAAQLLSLRPDLRCISLRGNVDTRLRKAQDGAMDAIVLAGAGLLRLGLEAHITEWLPLEVMLPAPGQGALAIQCRADDAETLSLLTAIEDPAARRATIAERAFLAGMHAGCSLPVAAYATQAGNKLLLTGLAASLDGRKIIRLQASGDEPEALGRRLAQEALDNGARELIDTWNASNQGSL